MAANLFQPSLARATDSSGNPVSAAKFNLYLTGTTTAATYYLDQEAQTLGTNPQTADSAGKFAPIYLDPDTVYRIKLTNETGSVTLYDVDPVRGFDIGMVQAAADIAIAAQEAAEAAAIEAGAAATAAAASATASDASADAAAADAAEVAAANQYRVSIARSTYTELAAITGTANQSGAVFGDAGTHTDPVVGGTVNNEGVFRYSTSPAGWEWLANLESADAATSAAAAAASAAAITKDYDIEVSGTVPEGGYPSARHLPFDVDIIRFYGVVLEGTGTIDATLLVNGSPVHGPTTIDSVGTELAGLTETAIAGDDIQIALTDTVGDVTSVYVRYEATPA